jgi:hypothetical protein
MRADASVLILTVDGRNLATDLCGVCKRLVHLWIRGRKMSTELALAISECQLV